MVEIVKRSASDPFAFLAGGGEMGERIRGFDWSNSPVGSAAAWPQSLKTALRIMLDARYPMFVWWGPGLTKFYNDPYAVVLGQRHPAALGRPAAEVWSDIWHIVGPQAQAALHEGRATWSEEQLLVMERNGFTEETYFTYSYSPVHDDEGKIAGVFCACTEDTSRVLGQRRLRTLRALSDQTAQAKTVECACEAAARTLAGNSHDLPFALLYLLDESGSQATLAGMTGVERFSAAVPSVVELRDSRATLPFRQVADLGQAVEIVDVSEKFGLFPCGDGLEFPQRAVVVPMARPGMARLAGFVVAGVSPRLIFNEDYRGFLDLLAGQVATAVANARAYEEERRRAEALAELDRAKTAFFSNVSHEFRTPLTLILGPLDDAIAETTQRWQRDRLELLRRNALRLQKLVNTLLDFSRIEAGRVQVRYQPVDLAAFTAELASNFQSACERAGLDLRVNCPALPEPVYVDIEMWEKIVLNLVSNAFKFTLEGGIEISLRARDGHAELVVADSGVGIPTDQIPKLFERFQRVEGVTGRSQEGSGIGLALVRELVRFHGGNIRAESQAGKGTCFTVTIPLGTDHLSAQPVESVSSRDLPSLAAPQYLAETQRWATDGAAGGDVDAQDLPFVTGSESEAGRAGAGDQSERSRILVVDDNADMRQYLTRLLAGNYEVRSAVDGQAAVECFRNWSPDLVLTDVMMPRLDGFGLIRRLRAEASTSEIPVIMLSARSGEESRIEGMEAGADDYLVKPFSARELLATVSSHLQMIRLRRAANQSLRESEERFRLLFERMIEAFAIDEIIFDENGRACDVRYLNANPAFEKHTGLKRDDILGRTTLEMFPEAESEWFERFGDVATTGIPQHFQARFGPLERWFEVSAYRTAPNQIATVFFDITEQKRAVESLRASEERLRNIFEQATAGIAQVDQSGQFVLVNHRFCEMTGYSEEELRQLTCQSLTHPDDRALDRSMFEALLTDRKPYAIEKRYVRKDGTTIWVRNSVSEFNDAQGRPQSMLAVSVDVSESKRAEALQRGQRNVLELIAKGAAQAQVLGAVCRLIEEQEAGLLCSILLTDDTGQHTGSGFGPSLPASFVQALQGINIARPHVGSCCAALDCGQEVLVADIEHDDRWHPVWRELNLKHGLRACRSIPIRGSDGSILASVAVFRRQPGDPAPANQNLLGIATYLAGIAIERRRAEDRERRLLLQAATANAQFRAFFEQGALFAAIMHIDGTLIEPNRLCLEACGYTREQVVGKRLWDCPWWNRSPELMQLIEDASAQAAAGEPYRAELPYYLADGTMRRIDFILLPVKDESGRVMFLAPTGTDITDRKRAEQQLAEAHEFLQSSLDALSSHIAVLDEHGVILAVNDAWRRFADENRYTGLNYGIGANYLEACESISNQRVVSEMAAGLKDVLAGRLTFFELEYPDHSRLQPRWFVMRATCFKSPSPVRVVVAHEDVTQRKLAEDGLKEADRRKDEFLATLAHELRNPLAPLRNGLQIMRLGKGNEPAIDQARTMMERQLSQMVHLVDDLLDLSRISRGQIELRKERIELAKIVQQAIETSRPLIEANDHRFAIDIPTQPVYVDADVTRLAQVFSNLLNNAAKYTDAGGQIRLSVERQADEVQVTVRDNGIGIPAHMLPHVFDIFTQVDRNLERSQSGLGIGLSIVKRLVEMHGGRVEVESDGHAQGSQFIVRLPVLPPMDSSATDTTQPSHRSGRRRILVVDDNKDAAVSLALMLKLMGNETQTAHDGLEALEVAATYRPDLILLDIGMPKMNGYDTARHIRQESWGQSIVLVALTGWGQDEDRRKSQDAGFDSHMTKPIELSELEKLLTNLATYRRHG